MNTSHPLKRFLALTVLALAAAASAHADNNSPLFVNEPLDAAATVGGGVSYSVFAAGEPTPTYAWQYSPDGGVTWGNLTDGIIYTGTATTILQLSNITKGMDGYQYRAVASNSGGTVFSDAALLSVLDAPASTLFVVNTAQGIGFHGAISKIQPSGTASIFVGNINTPSGMGFDASGNLYYMAYEPDSGYTTIYKVTTGGNTSTVATGVGISLDQTNNYFPALAVDNNSGNIYVSSPGGGTVARVTPDGTVTQNFLSNLSFATGLAVDSTGDLYVAQAFTGYIIKVSSTGAFLRNMASGLGHISSMTLDANGVLFVASQDQGKIYRITAGGAVSVYAKGLNSPSGLAFDAEGNLFVSSSGLGVIYEIAPGGAVATFDMGITRPISLAVTPTLTAPNFTSQPQGQNVLAGDPATFTASVSGSPLPTFQWQLSTDGGADWANVTDGGVYSGAMTTTLAISSAPSGFTDNQYRLVATNVVHSAISNAATLSVTVPPIPPPVINTQPVGTTVRAGATVHFTVSATGAGPLFYQWQKNGQNLSNGSGVSGVTSATLTLTNVDSSDAGKYRVVITNGGGQLISATAVLGVQTGPAAPKITQQPGAASVARGATAKFTVKAVGSGTLKYQWQKSGVNLKNSSKISGVTSATLTIKRAASSDAANYRVIVSNTLGKATSSSAHLTVK